MNAIFPEAWRCKPAAFQPRKGEARNRALEGEREATQSQQLTRTEHDTNTNRHAIAAAEKVDG